MMSSLNEPVLRAADRFAQQGMGVQSVSGTASVRLRRLWCCRAVMEKRTFALRHAATMSWVYKPLSARMVSGPVTPA